MASNAAPSDIMSWYRYCSFVYHSVIPWQCRITVRDVLCSVMTAACGRHRGAETSAEDRSIQEPSGVVNTLPNFCTKNHPHHVRLNFGTHLAPTTPVRTRHDSSESSHRSSIKVSPRSQTVFITRHHQWI